jgi:peptide/nickel transport system substrate-binding protein
MKLTRGLVAAVAVVGVAVALVGCSGSGSSDSVLRIGISAPIDSLNPFVSSSDYSSVTYEYVYPHLTEYHTQNLSIVGSFATSWSQSDGGDVWTFHTRKGATWSDGKPLTAADAAFTMNMILKFQNGPTGELAGFVNHLKKAVAVNSDTLQLDYSAPVANVLAQMQQLPILPEHIWAPLASGSGKKISTFQNGAPMVSGGPFELTKYQENQLALFSRNPNWYGTKPTITGFGLQMFANNDAMVEALKTNQVDMIGESTPATAVSTLKKAGMAVGTTPSDGFYDFIINTNPKKKQNPELLNPAVREALEYAINRDQLVKTAWLGHATPGSTIIAPSTGFHDSAITPLPFDPAKANSILDSLGYARGSTGIRVANGHPMSYSVIFPTEIDGAGDRMFQIIQSDFQAIGVNITERKMDDNATNTAILGSDNKYTGFDMAMWDWIPPVDPDFQLSVLTCAQWGNNSDSGYCNPAYDKLYAAQATATNRATRQSIINQMQEIAFNDRPYIVLVYQDVIEAHSKAWTGFLLSPLVGSVNNLSTQTLVGVHRAKS